jgi:hypothetical protein
MICGGCLCGEVRFEVRGSVSSMASCHCSRCRKAYGAAFGTVAVVQRKDFAYTAGEALIVSFQSSARVNRPFCQRCGSRLPIREEWDPLVGIPAGLLDDDPGTKPSSHIFVASKAPWWDITDSLPQHPEWAASEDFDARFEQLKKT